MLSTGSPESKQRVTLSTNVVVLLVVVAEGSLVPSMPETGLEGHTLSIIKTQAKKVRFESAFERV